VSGLRKGVFEFSLAVPFVGLFLGFELGGGICRVKSARERPEGSLHASSYLISWNSLKGLFKNLAFHSSRKVLKVGPSRQICCCLMMKGRGDVDGEQ
jgi:hypothetical protein